MLLKDHYWYFTEAIPPKICDNIIEHALNKKEESAKIGGRPPEKGYTKKELSMMKRKRNSDLVWLNDPWIYKEVQPYIARANKLAGWNFQWDWSEPMQFTKYKLNQYYDWHNDSHTDTYSKIKNKYSFGKTRKLSMTCQLTDGSEYEGGELEFDFRNYDPNMREEAKHLRKVKEILPKGSIVVFPSFVWHRVKPITKGVRYSLVMWNLGYPFK
tara:strand:- start:2527 stop:3165 length:639 start_codon:yes stop_codon:yes gene_type:complete